MKDSIAAHYHQRTKYAPETIGAKNKTLDWENQPIPYKEYKIGTVIDLKPYLNDETHFLTWQRLSRLLLCSYGLTAKMGTMYGPPVYLRSAPSAGGLYPAEVYLICRGNNMLPAGLYNYQVQTHSLVHFWQSQVWQDLQTACYQHRSLQRTEIALITTGIFWRSAWRYDDRAYRRIFLDTGHLLGNIELACALNDYRPHLIGGFQDEKLNQLLYLDSAQEGVLTVIPLADLRKPEENFPASLPALASGIDQEYPELADGDLLSYFHRATSITQATRPTLSEKLSVKDKYNFPFCLKVSTKTNPMDWGESLTHLETTILNRRSTRAYTGADIEFDDLKALLHFTYQPQDYLDQGLDLSPDYFELNLIQTFIAVSGVIGLEDGCYYYAPQTQELRQIRFKNFRRELHYLCLGQELGRDAAAIVFHTADLEEAVSKYGDRVYRYLHMDAGHLGQRLNLAAIQLDLGASGIGGFFDDQVNEVLGIPSDEAVIYITTLGSPRKR